MDRLISGVENLLYVSPVPKRSLNDMLDGIPEDIAQFALKSWDAGVFNNSLVEEKLAPDPTLASNPHTVDDDLSKSGNQIPGNITTGTYNGSQLAILEIFQRIENRSVPTVIIGVKTHLPVVMPPSMLLMGLKPTFQPGFL